MLYCQSYEVCRKTNHKEITSKLLLENDMMITFIQGVGEHGV